MNNPGILFVFPHVEEITGTCVDSFTESLGTSYIMAYLQMHGIYSAIYIQEKPTSVAAVVEEILNYKINVIGFSCYDSNFYICSLIAKNLKLRNPALSIVFGGPTATLSYRRILGSHHEVDICCIGEGEETSVEIIHAIKNGMPLNDVNGIAYRLKNKITVTKPRLIQSMSFTKCILDKYPSPYLAGFLAGRQHYAGGNDDLPVITSRGCIYKCTFCTNTVLRGNRVRYHSVQRIIDEIKYIKTKISPDRKIAFFDDAFTLNVLRAKQICRRIIDEKLNDISYICVTRIDRLDHDLIELMVKANFKSMYFGLESASALILKKIKKCYTGRTGADNSLQSESKFLDTVKKNVRLSQENGIDVIPSIIQGLPADNETEIGLTLAFVKRLGVKKYFHNYFKLIYGTESYEDCESYGIKKQISALPMQTKTVYAYDVAAVSPLDISINHQIQEIKNLENFTTFCDVFRTRDISSGDDGKLNVFIECVTHVRSVLTWLQNRLRFDAKIFIVERDWTNQSWNNVMNSIVDCGVPISHYVRLKEGKTDPILTYFQQHLANFDLCNNNEKWLWGENNKLHMMKSVALWKSLEDPYNGTKALLLNEGADLYECMRWLDTKSSLAIPTEDLWRWDCAIVDRCRFCSRCSVAELNNIIIDVKGGVKLCYSGPVVCYVGENLGQLRKDIEKQRKSTMLRRQCDICEISSTCPKCIYLPQNLPEEMYCKCMRQKAGLRTLFALFDIVKTIRKQKKALLHTKESVIISWLARDVLTNDFFHGSNITFSSWEILKFEIGSKAFIVNTRLGKVMDLPPQLSELWDLIAESHGTNNKIEHAIKKKSEKIPYADLKSSFFVYIQKALHLSPIQIIHQAFPNYFE